MLYITEFYKDTGGELLCTMCDQPTLSQKTGGARTVECVRGEAKTTTSFNDRYTANGGVGEKKIHGEDRGKREG